MISQEKTLIKELERSNQPILILTKTPFTVEMLAQTLEIKPSIVDSFTSKEGLEELRAKISTALTRPISSENRYFYILSAETLNKEQANTLLKLLEEPPPHLYIILECTNLSSVLPTIRSRCKLVSLQSDGLEYDRDSTIINLLTLPMVDYLNEVGKLSKEEFMEALKRGLEQLKKTGLNKNDFLRYKNISEILSKIYKSNVNHKLLAERLYINQKLGKE